MHVVFFILNSVLSFGIFSWCTSFSIKYHLFIIDKLISQTKKIEFFGFEFFLKKMIKGWKLVHTQALNALNKSEQVAGAP